MSARDALSLLGLSPTADARALRGAYLSAVKTAHPDKPGGDAERLRQVVEAYEVLRSSRPVAYAPRPWPKSKPASSTLTITPAEAVIGGVRAVPLEDGGEICVSLPPGLRVGDLLGVSGAALTVAVSAGSGSAVIGDDLFLTVQADRGILVNGGILDVLTPRGSIQVRVSLQDAARGLVRMTGGGLPARDPHPRGDLYIKLEASLSSTSETRAQYLLRRFVAAWAA